MALHAQQENYKIETLTKTRSQIVLNGLWDFQPVAATNQTTPDAASWGKIWVPGSWGGTTWNQVPGIAQKNNQWQQAVDKFNTAWYRTQFFIPASFKEKEIEIAFTRVSTDAIVYINDKKAGTINWSTGNIIVTDFVKFGSTNEIKILVAATPDEKQVAVLMGSASSQLSFKEASLKSKGITGDVVLVARPKGSYINDVFVQTSVKKREITIEAEMVDVKQAGIINFTAIIDDSAGSEQKKINANISVIAKDTQTIRFTATWDDAALWDIDSPAMYNLLLSVNVNGQVQDCYLLPFGFREFWAEGKNFFLNDKRINLRPFLEGSGSGMKEIIDGKIAGLKKNGFNFSEIWPDNFDERGFVEYWDETMNRADKKGYLLAGVALPFATYIMGESWVYQWDKPGVKEKFEQRMQLYLRRFRNHPSVVMWTTTGNFFGDDQDQNPLLIGRKNWIKNAEWNKNAQAGFEAIELIKKNDPTRLVFTHHGTYVGDVHTLNFYLNMLPLQEREEWMSEYSRRGQMPFIGVEFGTPLHCTFLRGRNGFGNNIKTEPLVTEFSAVYMGSKAFGVEENFYRQLIKNNFITGQTYKEWMPATLMENMTAFQHIQQLFTTNTWRSWRTYEVSGGMLPWNNGHGWNINYAAKEKVTMPVFATGRKGNFFAVAEKGDINFLQSPGWDIKPGGIALLQNNNQTLAYIAGSRAAFTAKDNHFKTTQSVEKQLIFFNDTRKEQQVNWHCEVWVGTNCIKKDSGKINRIPSGEKKNIVLQFEAPNINMAKADGEILLSAFIGGVHHTDTFSFRVYQLQSPAKKNVVVFDPVGKTKNMLLQLGYTITDWNSSNTNAPLVIIGREVLASNYKLPTDLETYISTGGKAIVFNQHPDSVLVKRGFRVSQYISRYVFPLDSVHPVTKGLDEIDFRNWCGNSTLTEAYPDYLDGKFKTDGRANVPYYGWHWGNRGGVATAAMEKPHQSGWRPILECEFDLAYSPLMEMNYKKGLLVWCALDVEDHYEDDPVAATIVNNLITYVAAKLPEQRNVFTAYIGDEAQEQLLLQSGVQYKKITSITDKVQLLICGNINKEQEQQVKQFILNGGKVLVLPRNEMGEFLGVHFNINDTFIGGKTIPTWNEARGISLSDIRFRTSHPTVLIEKGCNISMEGLLGKKTVGKGQIVFVQFNPLQFNADSFTYFRYSRWRQTRALNQVLANMGVSFINDDNIFKTNEKPLSNISLAGEWKVAFTKQLPGAKTLAEAYPDPGISKTANALVAAVADENSMTAIPVLMEVEKVKTSWAGLDGEMVYRKKVLVPKNVTTTSVSISLGTLDDYDQVYINGIKVGETDNRTKDTWNFNRYYLIPAGVLKEGENTVAIRIWDRYGGGGTTAGYTKRELFIKQEKANTPGLYHADYRDDYELGDDPFRYFRW